MFTHSSISTTQVNSCKVICMTVRKPRPRNARGEGDRLRDEVVEAAAALITENGPRALTLRAIARRVGITAPAIYAHFENVDDVLKAVVDSTFDALADHLREAGIGHDDPVDRLRAYCHAYVAFGRDRPLQYEILFSHAVELPQAGSPKDIENLEGGEAFAILDSAIRGCVAAGVSESTHPVDDAIAVWVALHGYVGLRTAVPDFPWPPGDTLLDVLIARLARLSSG
jgi:AcrR family transcriptional regulator